MFIGKEKIRLVSIILLVAIIPINKELLHEKTSTHVIALIHSV